MRDADRTLQIKGSPRWLGVHIAFVSALLSIVFGSLAILFGDNPDGLLFTTLFWMGGLSALMIFIGIAVQLALTFFPNRNTNHRP